MIIRSMAMQRAVIALAMLAAECGAGQPALVAPTPQPAPTPTFVLSGTVTDRISGAPVKDVRVVTQPKRLPFELFWPPLGLNEASNAVGHYLVSGATAVSPGIAWVVAQRDGYVQQCAETALLDGTVSLDLAVSSIADRQRLNASMATMPPDDRIVSGTIFETTPAGRRPVDDAIVGWEGSIDLFVAQTRSDAAGHYLLCLPRNHITGLFAQQNGASSDVDVDAGGDAVVDIELKPQ